MKKLYHLFFIVLFITSMQAQTLLFEDFSKKKCPPEGWTVEGVKNAWGIFQGNDEAGKIPECQFAPSVVGNKIFRLISPKFDTRNQKSLKLSFKQTIQTEPTKFDPLNMGVAVRSGNSDWKPVWTHSQNLDLKGEKFIYITKELGTEDFQFCFYYLGDPVKQNIFWFIDDILLRKHVSVDAKTLALVTPKQINPNKSFVPKASIKNDGATTASFPVTIDIHRDKQKVWSKTVSVNNLKSLETTEVSFENFTPDMPNKIYTAKVYTNLNNDKYKMNDTLVSTFTSYDNLKMVVWQQFTNTSCIFCKPRNVIIKKILDANKGKVVPIFIHCKNPSPNDPFYIASKKVSDAIYKYYEVPMTPFTLFSGPNALNIFFKEPQIWTAFEDQTIKYSPLIMSAVGQMSGNKYTSQIKIKTVGDIKYENYILQVGVTEDNLLYNGKNGEKRFNYVLRTLYPSEEGTPIKLAKGKELTKTIECVLDPSWKKANLKLFAYVQHKKTKQILQATMINNLTAIDETVSNTPEKYSLSQNYPNPFNPSTTIEYQIPEMVNVNLVVYDILGRKVKTLVNEVQNAGNYKVIFNAEGIASGVYFYKLTAGNFTNIKKVVYIK